MTLKSIKEYAAAIRDRYWRSNKAEKGKILDEFEKVTGYHRKAVIRLLSRAPKPRSKRVGRPSSYNTVLEPLITIWEASDRLCSKRLQPFIPEMIQVLKQKGELQLDASDEAKLTKLSAATMDRLLEPSRREGGRKPLSATRPGSLLKSSIPIRTFADWRENQSGFMEIDTVAHCGENLEGFYLNTLCGVDVASGWIECLPVWGKWQVRVQQAVHGIRRNLPFPLLGIDSDNGSEFINQCLWEYCRKNKITFTRSRPYKKNDSCHVEQKNGNIVRRLIGYDRYTSKLAYDSLGRIYNLIRLYVNFFQPTMKLLSKTRHGARVYKVYEKALTPYQRLLKMGALNDEKQLELASIYCGLNPVTLLKQIDDNLEKLWKLADRTHNSVTRIMSQQGCLR
jgi:hypothetical protein